MNVSSYGPANAYPGNTQNNNNSYYDARGERDFRGGPNGLGGPGGGPGMIPGGPPPMMLRGGPPLSQPGSGPPSARYTGGPMPMSAGPGGGGGSATSPRDGNEQRTGATVSYRFPWTSESFHPRRYYHRYQLESVTGNLSAQWTFQKEARFVASRVLRKVGKKMRLPYRTIYAAEHFYERYSAAHPEHTWKISKTPMDVAQTSFLLASKTEETMKKARELLMEVDKEANSAPQDETPQQFQQRVEEKKRDFLNYEQDILETVGFEFRTQQPQIYVIKHAKLLEDLQIVSPADSKALAQRAWLIVPEMNKCTDLGVRFSPQRLAAAAILLASETDIIYDEPSAQHIVPTGRRINFKSVKHVEHWLDVLPGIPFFVPPTSPAANAAANNNKPLTEEQLSKLALTHGRALVFEAAIDAADAIADYHFKMHREDLSVQIGEIALGFRNQQWSFPQNHPFRNMWPQWEDERRKKEAEERVPAIHFTKWVPPPIPAGPPMPMMGMGMGMGPPPPGMMGGPPMPPGPGMGPVPAMW